MEIPKRNDPSDFKDEDFEDYYARFPTELDHIPQDVVKNWMWYHNEQVVEFSKLYNFKKWNFELRDFDNNEVMTIKHFDYDLKLLDGKGQEFLKGLLNEHEAAKFMFENGTSPCPIIVAKDASKHIHHIRNEGNFMLEPYQLIEGNRRLAYLRAMIRKSYPKLKASHNVWVVTIGE
ncbi:hypothetical protein VHA01S_014_00660 [Vibrio halioticoli NBRC 102217]|uniref:ParB/Sulfiredoxin domain-containing protein n=1 Tax=Vibrio halioticoli NBRC 102217 TaxID=1219072 RepID=V5FGN9_9VIBR|nr:hypothetical protein [Vibrio halioticoli]GAD89041.1 hypothetical protein VHA01S_014_00660 [Vibrio halioticoli NBRC 102217]